MIKHKAYILLPSFETNTYLVWDSVTSEAILIDPAAPSETLKKEIKEMNLKLVHIINTHGHGDHIGGNEYFQREFGCPIGIHQDDADMLIKSSLNLSDLMGGSIKSPAAKTYITDQHTLYLGENKITCYHTPGHTRGGIAIYAPPHLFTGDTLFAQDVGRTDLPGGDMKQLIASIKTKLFALPDETIVYPGHGPASTIAREKAENPYV